MTNKVKVIIAGAISVILLISVIVLSTSSEKYEVTFNNEGVMTTQNVNEGETVAKPVDPTKDHYTFMYWSLDNKEYDFDSVITSDITLSSNFTEEEYLVTFKNGTEVVSTKKVVYNQTVDIIHLDENDDYVFSCWENNGEYYSFDSPITSNITLEAVWLYKEGLNTYTVSFNDGIQVTSTVVYENTMVKPIDDPKREDESFVFWMKDDIKFDFNSLVTSDIELIAKWEEKKFTVTFDSDGGSSVATQIIKNNEYITNIVPTKENCVFMYWTLDGDEFDINTKVTSDLDLVAVWSQDSYNVIFSSTGTSVATQSVKYNDLVVKPSNPTHPEAEFLYWSYNNKEFDFNTPVTSDIVLVAVFTDIVYTVSFDTDGGSYLDPQEVISTKGVIMPAKPTKEGYVFLYWELNEEQFIFGNPVSGDTVLKAVWKLDDGALTYYSVVFNSNGGDAVSQQYVVENGVIAYFDTPVRLSYDFLYWTYEGNIFDLNTPITSDITLNAFWKIHTVTISFDSNGGSYVSDKEIDIFSKISSPSTFRTDYKFLGWYLGDDLFDFSEVIIADASLVAKWEEVVRYTVTYDSVGGTQIDAQLVDFGNNAYKPNDPLKQDYSFAYWTFDSVQFDFNTAITGNITLVAYWVATEINIISFDTGGGSLVESQLCANFDKTSTPIQPTREGYLFIRWEVNGEVYTFDEVPSGDMIIRAVWLEIPVVIYFDVTFVNGNEVYSVVTVQNNTPTSSITLATTTEYKFSHWELNGEKFDFTTPITSDITLHAINTPRIYHTITYDLDGGVLGNNVTIQSTVEDGYYTSSVSNPTKQLHSFKRWVLEDGSTFVFRSTRVYSDIHITAVWEVEELSYTFLDKTVNYNGYSQSISVVESMPTGVILSYDISNSYVNAGVYVVTATATHNGEIKWQGTATLTILQIELTLSYTGDFIYESTGYALVPNVATDGYGWGTGDNTNADRGKFVMYYSTNMINIGKHTVTMKLENTTYSPDNYILINDTFEIEIIAVRQYNFEYVIENNQVIITGFYNTIQTTLVVPDRIDGYNVTTIQANAFSGITTLTSISLPNTIKTIESSAFKGCTSLLTADLGTGLEVISTEAFSGCTKLTTVTYGMLVNTIENNAFYDCKLLSSISTSSNIRIVGASAFYMCEKLSYLPFGNSIETLGESSFYGCDSLVDIVIPSSLTAIEKNTFHDCNGLKTLVIPNSIITIAYRAFYHCDSLNSVTFSTNLKEIGEEAFRQCHGLTVVSLPNSITTMGSRVFYDCDYLNEINIPSSLLVIPYQAFDFSIRLATVTIPSNSSLISIDAYAFRYTAFESITLPQSLTTIGSYAFSYITELSSIVIPDSVYSIGTNVFENCTNIASFTLPLGITSIPNAIFNNVKGLTSITIPSTVTSIGNNAFSNNTNVTSVKFASSNTLETIGTYAFSGLTNVESISIPISVTLINSYAFQSWTSLKTISIPSSVKTIGSYVFQACTSLTTVTIPSNVTSLGNGVFNNCTSIVNATINATVNNIPDSFFKGCTSLVNVSYPTTVVNIFDEVFSNCVSLANISFHPSVINIHHEAFLNCTSLKSIIIPITVTTIDYDAFKNAVNANFFVEAISKPSGWNANWNRYTGDGVTTGIVIWDYLNA